MIKCEELVNSMSCLNKAADDEMLFVLLGRDKAAPAAIRAWVTERISLGINQLDDMKIQNALRCADQMEELQWTRTT